MVDEFLRNGKSEQEYEEIKGEVINSRVPSRRPKLVILGGVPGAGKSTIIQALTIAIGETDKESFDLIISPDDVKGQVLQRLDISEENEKEWKELYQKEAWEITRDTLFRSLLRGHNVIYDATLGNQSKYMELFDFIDAHSLDYRVDLHIVHVELPVALKRAYSRGVTDKHTVPEEAIKHIHKVIPSNIIALLPSINFITFWNNNPELPPSDPNESFSMAMLFQQLYRNIFLKMIVVNETSDIFVEYADGKQLNELFADQYGNFTEKLMQYDVEFADPEHDFLNI